MKSKRCDAKLKERGSSHLRYSCTKVMTRRVVIYIYIYLELFKIRIILIETGFANYTTTKYMYKFFLCSFQIEFDSPAEDT